MGVETVDVPWVRLVQPMTEGRGGVFPRPQVLEEGNTRSVFDSAGQGGQRRG